MARQLSLFGRGHHAETPAEADIYSHDVSHGDVFVLATDGVWDNLAPEDILRIISVDMVRRQAWIMPETGEGKKDGAVRVGKELEGLATPKGWTDPTQAAAKEENSSENDKIELSTVLARAIVREAKHASIDSRRDGPFAKEVKRRFPWENYRGGKVDDICCVVGVVLQDGL
jgi:protein phosphatase PTC7